MRLGDYEALLAPGTKMHQFYTNPPAFSHPLSPALLDRGQGGQEKDALTIHERHRHRYEVNPAYHEILQKHGLVLSGLSPDGTLVEFIELKEHPCYIGTQAHPEFKSRLQKPHPMFLGFVQASLGV
jgi:CTP synthase